jgi:heme oxygenase
MPSANLPASPLSPLERLKSQTAPHHQRIETMVPLMRPDLTLAGYGSYLARLLPYYAALESRLSRVRWPEALDFPARFKTPLLEADLRALHEAARPPLSPTLPDLDSQSRAWGCLYVLEGSTLGSQILSRQVHEALGVTPETGGAFLHGYGPATGPRWKQFGAALTAFFSGDGDVDLAVIAAQETFTTLTDWLSLDQGRGRGEAR